MLYISSSEKNSNNNTKAVHIMSTCVPSPDLFCYYFPLILHLRCGSQTTHLHRHPPEDVSYAVWDMHRSLRDVWGATCADSHIWGSGSALFDLWRSLSFVSSSQGSLFLFVTLNLVLKCVSV